MKKLVLLFTLMFVIISCTSQKKGSKDFENRITEKYWKLKTLDGKLIEMAQNQQREIFITLRENGNINGFGGCNTFQGSYKTLSGNRIKFDNIITTMKYCEGINDQLILTVLKNADGFTVKNDFLTISKAGKVLATFEAVYF